MIPRIAESYNELRATIEKGKIDDIDNAFKLFNRSVLISDELLSADKNRVIDKIRKEVVEPWTKNTAVSKKAIDFQPKLLREYDIYN